MSTATKMREHLSNVIKIVRDEMCAEIAKRHPQIVVTYQHINNGMCEDFALAVQHDVPFEVEVVDDEIMCGKDYSHTFIQYGSLYYDAECPEGVADWTQLPIFCDENREVNWLPTVMIAAMIAE